MLGMHPRFFGYIYASNILPYKYMVHRIKLGCQSTIRMVYTVERHCGDNKASLSAHRQEIRRPLLCHVWLWLAIANNYILS